PSMILYLSSLCCTKLVPYVFFFILLLPHPRFTLFPYTTLFRSLQMYTLLYMYNFLVSICIFFSLCFFIIDFISIRSIPRQNYKRDRKSTRLNSSHVSISYAVFCLKEKTKTKGQYTKQLNIPYKH